MKTVRGKTWGVPRGKQYVHGWINPYRPILEAQREEQERPNIACLFYGNLENETPEQFILRQEEASLLHQAINRLDARLARVVRLRMEGLSLDEVGEQFGVTRERIRQMLCKAQRKLLKYLRRDFRDRYTALAKRRGWQQEMIPTERQIMEEDWARRSEEAARQYSAAKVAEGLQLREERLANLKAAELSRLEVERIRAENACPRTVHTGLYQPRLIDPLTGAWEWVEITREVYDASAA